MPKAKTHYPDAFCFSMLAVLTALLYHKVVSSYWLYDDPYILRHAFEHSPWEYFFIPEVWRELSIRYLTPWVTLSFDIDLSLFGFQPRFFYLHQLVSLWLAACTLYGVLRLWVKPGFAFSGSVLFLVSAPAGAAAEMLQIRHYIEGLIFCLLSLYFFVRALRKESYLFTFLSSLFYLLAASAKELYVPFGIIMLFLPEKTLRLRITRGIPLIISSIMYVIWRKWMLGNFIAGPGENSIFSVYKGMESIGLLLKNIYGTFLMMSGISSISSIVTPLIMMVFVTCILFSVFFLLKKKNYSVLLFFFTVTAAVYSVPLSVFQPYYIAHDFPAYRTIFLIAAYLSVILALSGHFLYEKTGAVVTRTLKISLRATVGFSIIGLLSIVQLNSFLWISKHREETIRPLAREGEFFMSADSNIMILKSDPVNSGVHYYENLEFFRKFYRGDEPPSVVYNGFAYIDSPGTSTIQHLRIFKYNPLSRAMSEISDSFFKQRTTLLSRIKKLPFSGNLKVDRGLIDFSLGPSRSGHYFILWGHKQGLYSMLIDIGQERIIKTRGLTRLKVYWRFGWESPEGWITLSPEWFVDFSKDQELVWSQ